MRIIQTVLLAAIIVMTGMSCSVQQKIALNHDGSGKADISINLDASLISYLKDLGESLGGKSPVGGSMFKTDLISTNLKAQGFTVTSIKTIGESGLELAFSFPDIRKISPARTTGSLFEYSPKPGANQLVFRLDSGRLQDILAGLPEELQMITGILVPQPGMEMTRDEYRDILIYALEESAGDKAAAIIDAASIEIQLSLPGDIVSFSGGTKAGRMITYRLPLVEALTLEKAIEYRIVFK